MDALKPAARSQNSGARSQESEQVSKPLEWEIQGIKHRKKLNANPQMLRHPGAPPRNFQIWANLTPVILTPDFWLLASDFWLLTPGS
jgi:hypothetical protein